MRPSAALGQLRTVGNDPRDVLAITEAKARLLKARNRDAELLELLSGFSTSQPAQAAAAAALFERYGFPARAELSLRAWANQDSLDPLRPLAIAALLGRQNRTDEALAICERAGRPHPPKR